MTFNFFPVLESQNKDGINIPQQLKDLANFVQTKENKANLFNGDQGGHIKFKHCPLNHFNIKKSDHKEILKHGLDQFQTKLKKLQTIDFKLGLSFTTGLLAIALATFTFGLSTLISGAAFGYFGYILKAREEARNEYITSQQQMTNIYIWAMNDSDAIISIDGKKITDMDNLIFHDDIKEMHNIFNPMLSDQNIMHYTHNKIDTPIAQKRAEQNQTAIDNETTTKLQLSRDYLLYGQHQGSNIQVAKGIFELSKRSVVDLFINLKNSFTSESDAIEEFVMGNVI